MKHDSLYNQILIKCTWVYFLIKTEEILPQKLEKTLIMAKTLEQH